MVDTVLECDVWRMKQCVREGWRVGEREKEKEDRTKGRQKETEGGRKRGRESGRGREGEKKREEEEKRERERVLVVKSRWKEERIQTKKKNGEAAELICRMVRPFLNRTRWLQERG